MGQGEAGGMEANASIMKFPNYARRSRLRAIAMGLASIAGALLLLLCVGFQSKSPGIIASADQNSVAQTGYVGSRVCSKCHPSIYESFSGTDMGRSMSEITPALLKRIPTAGSIFDPRLTRHFEIFARENNLYQSEYETTADGKDIFRETRRLDWIIG